MLQRYNAIGSEVGMNYKRWRKYTDEELRQQDLAELNLACAIGLPNTEVNVVACRDTLNKWTEAVIAATERLLPKFLQNPEKYENALGKFKMLVLVTVLQRDFGVSYNMAFMKGEYDGRNSRNILLHGILGGFGGTCVTMPMLYLIVGRRLGYPLFLAEAKEHYFLRWEGDGERFNIEATTKGFSPRDDDYYLKFPKKLTDVELKKGNYLRNFTVREEIAACWTNRAGCFFEHLMLDHAVEAYRQAEQLAPNLPNIQGPLLIAVTAHQILEIMETLPQSLSVAKRVAHATPPISLPWHPQAIRLAKNNIMRIYRNRQKSLREADSAVSVRFWSRSN